MIEQPSPVKYKYYYSGYSVNLPIQNGESIGSAYLRMQARPGAIPADRTRGIVIRTVDDGDDVFFTTADSIAAWAGYSFSTILAGNPDPFNFTAGITYVDVTLYIQAIVNRSGWAYGNTVNIRVDFSEGGSPIGELGDYDPDESGLVVNGVEYYGTFV